MLSIKLLSDLSFLLSSKTAKIVHRIRPSEERLCKTLWTYFWGNCLDYSDDKIKGEAFFKLFWYLLSMATK